jgi:predicted PurR-regulated permease PerM
VIAGFLLLVRFRNVLFTLFVAIVISTAISPFVNWLQRRGLSRAVGAALVFLLIIGAVGGFLATGAPVVLEQGTSISEVVPDYYSTLRSKLTGSSSYALRRLGYELPSQLTLSTSSANPPDPANPPDEGEQMLVQVTTAFKIADTIARIIFYTVAILLLAFYWTLDGERAVRSLLFLLPQSRRDSAREIVDEIQTRLGSYVLGQLLLCLTIGVLSLIAYVIIGLPNALLLAIFAGIMEAVPVFGPALGAAVPALLAVASGEPTKVIWIVIASLVIQAIENNLLVPRVGKSVGVNPIVTLLALAAFTTLFGVAGALLAIPLAAVFQMAIGRLLLDRGAAGVEEPVGRDTLSALRLEVQELTNDVRKYVREKEAVVDGESDKMEDSIEQIADQLDQILAQASANTEGNPASP